MPENDNLPVMAHKNEEKKTILEDINKVLKKGVMTERNREKDDFIWAKFTRKKKNGNMYTILNLKYLNKYVKYNYFKIKLLVDVF